MTLNFCTISSTFCPSVSSRKACQKCVSLNPIMSSPISSSSIYASLSTNSRKILVFWISNWSLSPKDVLLYWDFGQGMLFIKAWSENETFWRETLILDVITVFLVILSNWPAVKSIVMQKCAHSHFSGYLELASRNTTHAPSMISLLWFFVICSWNHSTDDNFLIIASDLLKTFTISNKLTTCSVPPEIQYVQ